MKLRNLTSGNNFSLATLRERALIEYRMVTMPQVVALIGFGMLGIVALGLLLKYGAPLIILLGLYFLYQLGNRLIDRDWR